jgi:translation elongation factor EF-G
VQGELLREALHRHPPAGEGAMVVAESAGVRVLARSEGALRLVVGGLRERFRDGIVVGSPTVRYAHGTQMLEPWMVVLMSGPAHFLPLIQKDLSRRQARVLRVEDHRGPFVLEAEAPLANLLGYADWLDALVEGSADLSMWLARYVPVVVDDGPEVA